MEFIESRLRCKGEIRSKADEEAAELIYAYILNYAITNESVKRMMKLERA